MKIQCDRCKRIYDSIEDTVVKSDKIGYPITNYTQASEGIDLHLCPLCRILLYDFVHENIPLKRKGKCQIEKEKDDKIYEDYFNSLEVK